MNESLKVEIRIIDGKWQWAGLLSKKQLRELCKIADKMNEGNTD